MRITLMAMYGKRRVVLGTKLTRSGKRIVSVDGCKSCFPLGFWYERDGLFYADLKSAEQQHRWLTNDEPLARVGMGACASKAALREFVMGYFNEMRAR